MTDEQYVRLFKLALHNRNFSKVYDPGLKARGLVHVERLPFNTMRSSITLDGLNYLKSRLAGVLA